VLLKHVLAFAITNVECVRKQTPIQHGMIFGSIFGFVDLFSCCKGINFARFRKIIHLLFLSNGIITQIFGINEKLIYKYYTNRMYDICKSISQMCIMPDFLPFNNKFR
jgi:hypothetical protein